MPIQDSQMVIRSSTEGTLLADSVISKEIEGTSIRGMTLHVQVPSATQGSVPRLAAYVHASTTSAAATTDPIVAARTGMQGGHEYEIPFSCKHRAIAVAFVISGGSTPGFSLVTSWLTNQVAQDWTRETAFH